MDNLPGGAGQWCRATKLRGKDYSISQLNYNLLLFQRYQHIIPLLAKSPLPFVGAGFRWGRRPCLPWLAGPEARPTYRRGDDTG